jgi:hypothetical protein
MARMSPDLMSRRECELLNQRVVSKSRNKPFFDSYFSQAQLYEFPLYEIIQFSLKCKGNRFLGRPRRGQEENVKTVLKEEGCEGVKKIQLAQVVSGGWML